MLDAPRLYTGLRNHNTAYRMSSPVMNTVDILIADDHELVRKGLISILTKSHPEWRVVGDVATGSAAIELGIALRPGVAILDLSMPDIGGLHVAKELLKSVPGIRVIILTMHAATPILRQVRRAGVKACLTKNEAPKTLVNAVERILAGEPFFASDSATRPTPEAPGYIPTQFLLTARELDVLRLLARGKSNKELASDLGMGIRTAESHHAHILSKLKASSLGDLVRLAVRDGII
jgi:DNA-binding NarL/FixJ family response regulator